MTDNVGMFVRDIVRKAAIGRESIPEFERLRIQAFKVAQDVYDDRVISYNVDHPCYEEMVYGPVSLASEVFKRARRLAALLSPIREEPFRTVDINRMLDSCVDTINCLTWLYALVIMATGHEGHLNSDDSPKYVLGTVNQVLTKLGILREEEDNG